jgi:hypothetical protein
LWARLSSAVTLRAESLPLLVNHHEVSTHRHGGRGQHASMQRRIERPRASEFVSQIGRSSIVSATATGGGITGRSSWKHATPPTPQRDQTTDDRRPGQTTPHQPDPCRCVAAVPASAHTHTHTHARTAATHDRECVFDVAISSRRPFLPSTLIILMPPPPFDVHHAHADLLLSKTVVHYEVNLTFLLAMANLTLFAVPRRPPLPRMLLATLSLLDAPVSVSRLSAAF